MINFIKSHGLGNDYIVIDGKDLKYSISKSMIKKICHRNYGVGSDGILMLCKSKRADYGLKIFNPDGTEAEKSGNGLRIFSSYLYKSKKIRKNKKITIETKGGIVTSQFIKRVGKKTFIKVEMGRASFDKSKIPINIKSSEKECLNKKIKSDKKIFLFQGVSVGNPHCVIFQKNISEKDAKFYGEKIERHHFFPKRTNVQFAKILDKNNVQIEIWERGAGYTLASGSSSCAVVSAGFMLGILNNNVLVKMPGGKLRISIDNNFNLMMEGPVEDICSGKLNL